MQAGGFAVKALKTESAEAAGEVVALLLDRARGGEALFTAVMRRYNQRLYRIARAILRDDGEAEDVLQDGYVRAFENLGQLKDPARFSSWISRIVVYEAWTRLRRRRQQASLAPSLAEAASQQLAAAPDPEAEMDHRQRSAVLEAAIDALSIGYRTVFMMRDVEEMSVAETAQCLGIKEGAVKTRLHRARAALREEVWRRMGGPRAEPFRFDGARCDRIVAGVLLRIHPVDQ
ncbi:MAG: RNA polymerase sigma factor [Deltaproteobacteria bacterium]|nr:MAG: RNA polymerase sigma factor [Deltaproteobacteria bacterium]